MRDRSIGIAFGALLATTALSAPAQAQIEPPYRNWDENGVDLVQGDFELSFKEGSIGSGPAELSLVRHGAGSTSTQWDRVTFRQTKSGSVVTTRIGMPDGSFEIFQNGMNTKADGGTLSGLGTYTARDGTKIEFISGGGSDEQPSNFCGTLGGGYPCELIPKTITYPDGRTIDFGFFVTSDGALPPNYRTYSWRLLTVTNSFGYRIWFGYSNGLRTIARFQRDGVTQGTVSYAYPSGATVIDVTDFAGNIWRVTGTATTKSIQRPGESTPFISATSSVLVTSSVTRNGVTTNYNRAVNGNTVTTTITNALNQQTVVVGDLAKSRPTSITDPLNRTTNYQYDANGRMTRVTHPEGNYTEFTYDGRGNVTQSRSVAKSGSGLADIIRTASFDPTCSNPVKCNKPHTKTDARGNTTDYTYDPTHGGITTVTLPAPTVSAVRPQTRYSYTLLNGEYQLTGVSQCQTLASCAGAADETKSSLGYDIYGNVTSVSSGDGTGALTATQAMSYDAKGDLLTVDGPLADAGDTTRFRYDAARRLIGAIGPDPDGAGAGLKHRAIRTTYDIAGRVTKQELGTVDSQSDPHWAAFSVAQEVQTVFDGNSRPIRSTLVSGGTAYSVTQLSYDALGRPECQAIRMSYFNLPESACTQQAPNPTFGHDRISKTVYDAAGQVTEQRVAVGVTGEEVAEATFTYTGNGRLQTLKDAENNLTTYEYDGFDRIKKTRYPVTTQGANQSSLTDFEELAYDPNGNVTSRIPRGGSGANPFNYVYDALNRLTAKGPPNPEPTTSYSYDNLGRLTSTTLAGNSLSFSYDALSRNLTQTGPQGTVSSQWDIAGRRTRLTWPDGFFVDYDYLVTGNMTKIRENGATSGAGVLATFAYDDLGRRVSLTRGNGALTTYAYDPVSRLQTLTDKPSSASWDQVISFTYNPASQIVTRTASNDIYAWTGHGNGSTTSVADGLNRLTSIGGTATQHDIRGNVTFDPTSGKSYTYSSENLLKTASGGVALTYDPAMRLQQVSGGSTTRFAYDGLNMIAEYDGAGTMLARYVHGPGIDQPLVRYDGSGTSNKVSLHSDERGSITALSYGSPYAPTINRYDEFGKPQSSNIGRFQYTGQVWLAELGAYYFKARIYAAHLGRFLQTDPVGMAGSPNLYAYVINDPIGLVDPFGLVQCTGSHLNRDNCGNSPDPVSCVGSCGHWATVIERSAAAPPTYREGTGDFYEQLGDCLANLDRCLHPQSGQSTGANYPFVPTSYSATLGAIISDPDVRASIKLAWNLSNPFGSLGSKNEHGFWIGRNGTDYYAGPMLIGRGNMTPMDPRLPGSSIYFHVHPFSPSEGYNPWFSPTDLMHIQQMRIMMIIVSNVGNNRAVVYEYDFRR